jgi:hypothetical protein
MANALRDQLRRVLSNRPNIGEAAVFDLAA